MNLNQNVRIQQQQQPMELKTMAKHHQKYVRFHFPNQKKSLFFSIRLHEHPTDQMHLLVQLLLVQNHQQVNNDDQQLTTVQQR